MEKLTLRDAADRTRLSVTTLRRYIRSGRLIAERTPGRYGPEYTVTLLALEQAGARTAVQAGGGGAEEPGSASQALASRPGLHALTTAPRGALLPDTLLREMIPIDLFRELSMKHEQLLVQYGMVRVGGQKLMEYKVEAERLDEVFREAQSAAKADRERYAREVGFLKKHLREAELEIETKNQELAALREKVRILELLSRNAITTESIERQFLEVFEKRRALEEIATTSSDERRRKMAALDELLKPPPPSRREQEPTDQ